MKLDKNLRNALWAEVSPDSALGAGADANQHLRTAQLHSLRLLYGAATMASTLFVFMIVMILMLRDNLPMVSALGVILGSTVAGLIALVVRMSNAVTQAGLLMALVSELPKEDSAEAIRAILRADGTPPNRIETGRLPISEITP